MWSARKARFESWEQLGVDAIRTDLEMTGGLRFVGGPPSVRNLAWEWVRMKERQKPEPVSPSTSNSPTTPPQQKPEVFTVRPSFWGMSIDLKELGRRIVTWWRTLKQ